MGYVVTAQNKLERDKRQPISNAFDTKAQAEACMKRYKKGVNGIKRKYVALHNFKIKKV